MAVICRAFAPVQMTKKSVKPPVLRRSSTTTSSAFLSQTAITAAATSLGRRGFLVSPARLVFVLRGRSRPLVVAMQAAYRPIEMMVHDVPGDGVRHEVVDRLTRAEPRADHRRRNVARASFDENDSSLTVVWDRFSAAMQSLTELRRPRGCRLQTGARACNHHEMRTVQYGWKLAPGGNFREGICAENEQNLARRAALGMHRPQRVGCV